MGGAGEGGSRHILKGAPCHFLPRQGSWGRGHSLPVWRRPPVVSWTWVSELPPELTPGRGTRAEPGGRVETGGCFQSHPGRVSSGQGQPSVSGATGGPQRVFLKQQGWELSRAAPGDSEEPVLSFAVMGEAPRTPGANIRRDE